MIAVSVLSILAYLLLVVFMTPRFAMILTYVPSILAMMRRVVNLQILVIHATMTMNVPLIAAILKLVALIQELAVMWMHVTLILAILKSDVKVLKKLVMITTLALGTYVILMMAVHI
jgi:hypothetical protein